jgi:hypothetical protein
MSRAGAAQLNDAHGPNRFNHGHEIDDDARTPTFTRTSTSPRGFIARPSHRPHRRGSPWYGILTTFIGP